MRQKSGTREEPAEKVIRDIRRATRKQYSAEEKNRSAMRPAASSSPMGSSQGCGFGPAAVELRHSAGLVQYLSNTHGGAAGGTDGLAAG